MNVKTIDEKTFSDFADRHPYGSVFQTVEMGNMQKAENRPVEYLGIFDEDGQLKGATLAVYYPIARIEKMALLTRGPVLDWDDEKLVKDAMLSLKDYFKNKGIMYFRMCPYVEYARHGLDGEVLEGTKVRKELVDELKSLGMEHEGFTVGIDLNRESRWIYLVPLEGKDEKSLMSSFERKTKRSVKKAIDSGCEVRELSREQLPLYSKILQDTYEKHHFQWQSENYFETVYDCFHDSGKVKFLSVWLNLDKYEKTLRDDLAEKEKILETTQGNSPKMIKRRELAEKLKNELLEKLDKLEEMKKENPSGEILLSAGLFYITDQEVICLMSGTKSKYLQFAAPYLMHWEVMLDSIEKHRPHYNLYGCSGDFSEDAIDRGVFLFKAGFQGIMSELVGDFIMPCQDLKYKGYKGLKSMLGRSA